MRFLHLKFYIFTPYKKSYYYSIYCLHCLQPFNLLICKHFGINKGLFIFVYIVYVPIFATLA